MGTPKGYEISLIYAFTWAYFREPCWVLYRLFQLANSRILSWIISRIIFSPLFSLFYLSRLFIWMLHFQDRSFHCLTFSIQYAILLSFCFISWGTILFHLFTNLRKGKGFRISVVAQKWIKIHRPMHGTWVWSLAEKDPTSLRVTKPVCHDYWSWVLEPVLCNRRSYLSDKPTHLESSPRAPQLEKTLE